MKYRLHIILILAALLFQCSIRPKPEALQVDFITVQEEVQLGEIIQERIASKFNLIRNSKVNEYFNLMATEISLVSQWKDLPYRVFIINSEEPFHFALPGGGICIYRGVLEHLESYEECAALLAIHIAHINLRHSTDKLAERYGYAIAAQRVMGENPQIAQDVIDKLFTDNSIINFSQPEILQADANAAQYLKDAGYSPQYLVTVLSRLDNLTKSSNTSIDFFQISEKRIRIAKQLARKNTTFTTSVLFQKDFPLILSIISQISR